MSLLARLHSCVGRFFFSALHAGVGDGAFVAGRPLVMSQPLICPGHSRPVAAIEFSEETADGVFLISACHDKTAMLRSGETGDWIGTFEGHKGAVWGAALNRPATHAVTCSADFSAKVWDAITGDELHTLPHKHIVRCAGWSPDSTCFVTGGKEKQLRLFDLMGGAPSEPQLLQGHTACVKVVRYLNDKNSILSAGEDKTMRIWDVRTGGTVRQLDFGGHINSVELTADGSLMTVAAGTEVSFWDVSSWQCLQRFNLGVIEANGFGVNSVSLHPNKTTFVAGGGNFWVYQHDIRTGEELACNKGHHGPIYGVRFTPDGKVCFCRTVHLTAPRIGHAAG
jgi:serine-threonine kinase receptor-associated protein